MDDLYTLRIGSALLIAVTAAVPALLGFPPPAQAAPVSCPVVAGLSRCSVQDGDAELIVSAKSDPGGQLSVELFVGGTFQFLGGFAVAETTEPDFPDFDLLSATVDLQARQITTIFREQEFGALDFTATFTLDDLGDLHEVTESVTIRNNIGVPIQGRVYGYVDFDLNGDSIDQTASGSGTKIMQTDGSTEGTFGWISGSQPNAFQVSECCSLFQSLFQFFTLVNLNNSTAQGPLNFEAAFSWDLTVTAVGQTFNTTVRKTVTVADSDADGRPDQSDNCPFEPNNAGEDIQRDTDGNRRGDACECGNADRNMAVDIFDALHIAQGTLQPPLVEMIHPRACDADGNGTCDIFDALRVAQATLAPPLAEIVQECEAATIAPIQ